MRIVAGKFKGKPLAVPKSDAIRPTTDRARESLFNILIHNEHFDLKGARVIDLFSGTGALAFEALSRGAEFALFVDMSVEARGLIRSNIETMGAQGITKLFRRDATKLGGIGTMYPFTLAFLDPPYGKGLGEQALHSLHAGGWLKQGAGCVLEEAKGAEVILPPHFKMIDTRDYSSSRLYFLLYDGDEAIKEE